MNVVLVVNIVWFSCLFVFCLVGWLFWGEGGKVYNCCVLENRWVKGFPQICVVLNDDLYEVLN